MTDREAIDVLINEWKCIARNDGIHCDRKCESCDLVMDVEVIREAYSMAISALQEQDSKTKRCATCKHNPPSKKWPCVDCDMREPADRWEPKEAKHSTESSSTHRALDTISRQEAIDVCDNAIDLWHGQLGEGIVIAVKKKIEELLPAQPKIEERKAESAQNVPKEDLISRKAAIDAMSESLKRVFPEHRQIAEKCLNVLPSAQPEPHWIPVSERLPEVGHSVLLSRRSMDTREGCLQADGKWWQYRWNEILNANQVNAWMPLPEPYRAERRTDE